MSDRRGSVFVDPAPDSPAPYRPVPAPVSASDIIGAHWTLTQQDFVGAPETAEAGGYQDLLKALYAHQPEAYPGSQHYVGSPNPGEAFNYTKIWQDIHDIRARDPEFLNAIPATNRDEFSKWVQQQEAKSRGVAQNVTAHQQGTGQNLLGLGTDVAGGFVDPVNLMTLPFGGGAKTVFGVMARQALLNGAIEAAELPVIAHNRAQFGEHMTAGDAVQDVLTAAAGGAVFGGGLHVTGHVIGKGIDAALNSDLGRAAAFAGQHLAAVTPDDVVAAAFREVVPAEIRTPDQQAALHVVDRQSEIAATSPYQPTPAGMDAHADNLEAAMRTVAGAIDPNAPIPPAIPRRETVPNVPRGTAATGAAPDLSPARIVRFVQNDLEGGATVVHFSQADGGTTKYGIAQAANPGVDVASLTADQAAAIAHRKYWLPEFDHVDPRIAAVGFDAGYISGPETARRILRESGGDPVKAIALYREHLNHIADTVPGKEKFRKGWNNRIDKLQRLVGGDDRPVLRPEAFDDEGDLAASQAAIDHAEMDAQLARHEAALAARGGEGEVAFPMTERSPQAGAMEASAVLATPEARAAAGVAEPSATAPDVPRETVDVPRPDHPNGELLREAPEPKPEEVALARKLARNVAATHDHADNLIPAAVDAFAKGYAEAKLDHEAVTGGPHVDAYEAGALQGRFDRLYEKYPSLTLGEANALARLPRDVLQRVEAGGPDRVRSELERMQAGAREADPYRAIREQRLGWSDGRPPASQLSAAGDHAIGTADVTLAREAARGFDDPHGAAAKEQVEGLTHDIKQRLEAGELGAEHFATSGVEIAGGDTAPIYQNAHAILAALDEEDAALVALRGCM